MSDYIKHTWQNGEPISADKLNNMETGIAEANKSAEDAAVAAQNAEAIIEKANEYDLVVVVDGISSDHYVYQLNADDLSIESGSVADTITKIVNGGHANVLVKLTYIYGTQFYMQFVPENVMATINYSGNSDYNSLQIRFGPLTHYENMSTSPFVMAEITIKNNGDKDVSLYYYDANGYRVEPNKWTN